MLILTDMMSAERCYEEIRQLRWPEQVSCPHCQSDEVILRGKHSTQTARQRYECKHCQKRFDDLTGTPLKGHHLPITAWVLCIYLMGLNLSNRQIAQELDISESEAHKMCQQIREMVNEKKHFPSSVEKSSLMRPTLSQAIKDSLSR